MNAPSLLFYTLAWFFFNGGKDNKLKEILKILVYFLCYFKIDISWESYIFLTKFLIDLWKLLNVELWIRPKMVWRKKRTVKLMLHIFQLFIKKNYYRICRFCLLFKDMHHTTNYCVFTIFSGNCYLFFK